MFTQTVVREPPLSLGDSVSMAIATKLTNHKASQHSIWWTWSKCDITISSLVLTDTFSTDSAHKYIWLTYTASFRSTICLFTYNTLISGALALYTKNHYFSIWSKGLLSALFKKMPPRSCTIGFPLFIFNGKHFIIICKACSTTSSHYQCLWGPNQALLQLEWITWQHTSWSHGSSQWRIVACLEL